MVAEFPIIGKRNRLIAAVSIDPMVWPFSAALPTTKDVLGSAAIGGTLSTLSFYAAWADIARRSFTMRWTKPIIVEVAVGLEINSYACAEIA